MSDMRYSVAHVPTVQRFMRSDAFIRGLRGPFGSGKSSGCVMDIINRCVRQRPSTDGVRRTKWAVIRNTNKQLEDTTVRTVLDWFPPHQFGEYRPSDSRYLIKGITAGNREPPCDIEFLFRALDRPEQVGNLLSLDLTGAWVNEAREVPWAVIEAVQGRVGRFPARRDNGGATWSGLIMDTNPPDIDSKWFKFFEEEDHSEAVAVLAKIMPGLTVDTYAKQFVQPSGLSPAAENLTNLPLGYYQRMAVGKTKEWVRVYIQGDYGFDLSGKPVFEEYDDDLHCKECHTVDGRPVYRGWDFGLTPACTFSQLLPSGQWIVVDELVSSSMGVDRFSDDVLAHSALFYAGAEFRDIGDPAGMQRSQTDEKTCFQILQSKNIEIEPGQQGLQVRLESIRKPLVTMIGKGKPQFLLHPRCKMLRRAFMGGYQWRKLKTAGERYSTEPDKNEFSHPMDALEYPATMIFGNLLRFGEAIGGRDRWGDAPGEHRIDNPTRSPITGY
jgi:hypothetical protein